MFGAKTEKKLDSEHKFIVFILDSRILAFSLAWDVKLSIRERRLLSAALSCYIKTGRGIDLHINHAKSMDILRCSSAGEVYEKNMLKWL